MSRRNRRCPDCDGPHGRGYHMCPTPLKNFEEPAPNPEYVQAVENYETWLADVDAHFGAGSANKIVSLFCAWEKLKEF